MSKGVPPTSPDHITDEESPLCKKPVRIQMKCGDINDLGFRLIDRKAELSQSWDDMFDIRITCPAHPPNVASSRYHRLKEETANREVLTEEIYSTIVTPAISKVINGYNFTVFAYGQTGAGKTYTMEDDYNDQTYNEWPVLSRAGIIPRAVGDIYRKLKKCLLTLGRVIYALTIKSPHISYRESKLTRILKDSFGGTTKTAMTVNISPAGSCLEETINSLDSAKRAQNIKNTPEKNPKIEKSQLTQVCDGGL
ncbi:kinesin-like protein bimC [Octopus sinensis]|uniref:Kinesin-like protein bimC n=1 Tax=Octopus sinensis TaxID=2607531 RepID=A0A7E6EJ81_9MOLL|nr:kinesin-like protein bimC [Octopus sinensis]